ncbi:hypothetical protein T310_9906 [Rasamsonia emersonii CBS 393.64]|uniref:Uncharacterized protein n=1 Tax=Rasamsonia emersonii (strain ATCC 16479 / CBS 393.64 / IMI 116815) TaxID=1408163 RepID=A0A0F4YEU6_RASE3|nr:hypothetical protein T310_9906 [Rasamsonia emersonii CBS 393.64]KKA16501.1 hypothetical protein T310_9906 [Rasamsonia emersonii CBS 393.64]
MDAEMKYWNLPIITNHEVMSIQQVTETLSQGKVILPIAGDGKYHKRQRVHILGPKIGLSDEAIRGRSYRLGRCWLVSKLLGVLCNLCGIRLAG